MSTTADLYAALELRYQQPEYALFTNVANGTGWQGSGYADAVAMGLWPSRGLHLQGFEVKASRGDWLRELKKPAKAEAFVAYCDRWWIVAGQGVVAELGEVPPTWGLLTLHGKKLRMQREAPQLEPQPLPRRMLGAILRRAEEGMAHRLQLAHQKGFDAGTAEGPDEHRLRMDVVVRERDSSRRAIDAFQAASGIDIRSWQAGDIAAIVKRLLEAKRTTLEPKRHVEILLGSLDNLRGALERYLHYECELDGARETLAGAASHDPGGPVTLAAEGVR